MSASAIANRGFNLLGTTLLAMGGLLFGAVVFQEKDLADKVDDGGFLLIAVLGLAWYLWRAHCVERSAAPIIFSTVAVLVQIAGLILERDDSAAFGDNIGGMLYFGATVVLLVVQYRSTGRIAALAAPEARALKRPPR